MLHYLSEIAKLQTNKQNPLKLDQPINIVKCEALPGVLGIQGEGLFIFRDLGRRVIYFQGFGEKAGF